MCLKEIGLRAHNLSTILDSIVLTKNKKGEGGMYYYRINTRHAYDNHAHNCFKRGLMSNPNFVLLLLMLHHRLLMQQKFPCFHLIDR